MIHEENKTNAAMGWDLWCWRVIIVWIGGPAWAEQRAAPATPAGRPDQITINTLAAFEKLELPPVTYFHDKHTDALAKEKKGCETCHFVEDNKLSLTYQAPKTTKPEEIKDIYHASCIGCHNEMAAAGKKTGPQDGFCRSCHNAEPPVAWPGWMPGWTRSCTSGTWTPRASPRGR